MLRDPTNPTSAEGADEAIDVSWEDHLRARHDERRPGLYPMRIRPFLGAPLADGRFVTDGYIGRGAFGCVFRGRQTSLHGRPVAVKLLIPPSGRDGDSDLMAQFERAAYYFDREASILARLNHPCIVQILDNGMEGGAVWIAMELVEGRSLSDLLNDPNEVWTWSRILSVSRGVLAGLAAAHANHVIHRDLKPPNIMVTNPVGFQDAVKLLDFGVSKLFKMLHERRSQTVIGTPEYMAPEQWSGLPIDQRTDIYAFGVILYQLVSGGLPFHGADVRELSEKHLRARVPPPQPRVGLMRIAAVDEIIRRALSKDPEERFADAPTMLEALQSAIRDGVPDPADLLPDLLRGGGAPGRLVADDAPPPPHEGTRFGPPAPELLRAFANGTIDSPTATAFLAGAGLPADTIVDLHRWFAQDARMAAENGTAGNGAGRGVARGNGAGGNGAGGNGAGGNGAGGNGAARVITDPTRGGR